MVVLILERAAPALRGEITRWLIQPQAGVFVGWLSARVRDLLWQRIMASASKGAGTMIYSDDTEQGFSVRSFGHPSKVIQDFEGIFLAKTPKTE
jgi:CRISPR-associated protein Cas2